MRSLAVIFDCWSWQRAFSAWSLLLSFGFRNQVWEKSAPSAISRDSVWEWILSVADERLCGSENVRFNGESEGGFILLHGNHWRRWQHWSVIVMLRLRGVIIMRRVILIILRRWFRRAREVSAVVNSLVGRCSRTLRLNGVIYLAP